MYYVSFGAVRRRTGQAVLLSVLAVLLATAAVRPPSSPCSRSSG
jgi:hypothetical protein